MALQKTDVSAFNALRGSMPVLDVRSPSEFHHAHIPGALSFPLFTDDERKEIGTAYKRRSREEAIKIGLNAFGKNLVAMVETAEKLAPSKQVAVHCWRGGMRSAAVAWLLDLYGFKVHVLQGGYKSWRRWALSILENPPSLQILGGHTGSNKTGVISAMIKAGIPAIDLEGIASHKGSAFGNLDRVPQPSQELFENHLADKLAELSGSRAIWLEAESQRIGMIHVPFPFFSKMRESPITVIDVPFSERLAFIVKGYGTYEKESLINGVVRIKKKLGGLAAKQAVAHIMDDEVSASFAILLEYYDKLYGRSLKESDAARTIRLVPCPTVDPDDNLKRILANE